MISIYQKKYARKGEEEAYKEGKRGREGKGKAFRFGEGEEEGRGSEGTEVRRLKKKGKGDMDFVRISGAHWELRDFILGALIAELWYNFGNSFGDKGKQKDALTSK